MIYWDFEIGPIHGTYTRTSMWVRFWSNGPGLQLKCTPPFFSEREGYYRSFRLWGAGPRIKARKNLPPARSVRTLEPRRKVPSLQAARLVTTYGATS